MSRRLLRLAAVASPLVLTALVSGGWTSADGRRSAAPGPSAVTAASSAAATGGLVVNMPVGPATLDPAEACGLTDITVIENVYSRLMKYGSKRGPNGTTQVDPGHMVPYAAKS